MSDDLVFRFSDVLWKGQVVSISDGEREIVAALTKREGKPRRALELYAALHANPSLLEYRDEADPCIATNMRSAIKRIRAKFRAVDPDFNAIEVVPPRAYRWVCAAASKAAA